jgi:hypothetical protein
MHGYFDVSRRDGTNWELGYPKRTVKFVTGLKPFPGCEGDEHALTLIAVELGITELFDGRSHGA